jgi:Zn-finger nucleic acid-binding protein
MIFRTSYGEFGHCTKCGYDFNSEELWEQEIELCPKCGESLYMSENTGHFIPEDTAQMEMESWNRFEMYRDKMIEERRLNYGKQSKT